MTVVLDEAQLPKFVHELADARSRCADHLGQRLLADFCDDPLRLALLAEIRQQQKSAGQPLLDLIEQFIDQVLLDPQRPGQMMCYEHL
jgi:hypothetical protein